jgi:hypothetical protein
MLELYIRVLSVLTENLLCVRQTYANLSGMLTVVGKLFPALHNIYNALFFKLSQL